METADLCALLTAYAAVVCAAALHAVLGRRSAGTVSLALFAAAALAAAVVLGALAEPGRNWPLLLARRVLRRDASTVVATGLGAAAGLAWWALSVRPAGVGGGRLGRFLEWSLLAGSLAGVTGGAAAFVAKDLFPVPTPSPTRMHAAGFRIEEVARVDEYPLRLAADGSGGVYVSYDYVRQNGTLGGGILAIDRGEDGAWRTRRVAGGPWLFRPWGLAVRDRALWVSRSGFAAGFRAGRLGYEAQGAVTRLEDLDGDGWFEYGHDVVSGLPGLRGPDTMHQNGGICFGPGGALFVTTAHDADRSLDARGRAGVLLEVDPETGEEEVFARGFRNPFAVAAGPGGELFLTDNDVEENPGDEVNHVIEGEHYGHPFVVPGEAGVRARGFRAPIHRDEGNANLVGIAWTDSPALPEPYRGCLYVTDFTGDRVLRLRLRREGETFAVEEVAPFASIPSPVDVAAGPGGVIWVLSRYERKVFRIRPPARATRRTDA